MKEFTNKNLIDAIKESNDFQYKEEYIDLVKSHEKTKELLSSERKLSAAREDLDASVNKMDRFLKVVVFAITVYIAKDLFLPSNN